jgi:hypothetical protein
MRTLYPAALAIALYATPAFAEARTQGFDTPATLPANSPIVVSVDEELNSGRNKVGDTFSMTVAEDVVVDGSVVIPRGARAVGEVTSRTGKGMFGKSGKMELAVRSVEVGGRQIPVEGNFREEGKGNKEAAIWGAVWVGPFAAVITGKNAVVSKARALTVRTMEALPVRDAAPVREASLSMGASAIMASSASRP